MAQDPGCSDTAKNEALVLATKDFFVLATRSHFLQCTESFVHFKNKRKCSQGMKRDAGAGRQSRQGLGARELPFGLMLDSLRWTLSLGVSLSGKNTVNTSRFICTKGMDKRLVQA